MLVKTAEGILEHPVVYTKVWGTEEHLTREGAIGYTGKKMTLKEKGCCSTHFHALKCETFYVQSGSMVLQYWTKDGKSHSIKMGQGMAFTITPLTPHRFYGLEETVFFEFSTLDAPEDSYRIDKSSCCFSMPDTMYTDLHCP